MPPAHPGDLPLLLSKFRDGNFSNISSSGDIQGGVDYGIDTCWYNLTGEIKPDGLKTIYEIKHLRELLEVIK